MKVFRITVAAIAFAAFTILAQTQTRLLKFGALPLKTLPRLLLRQISASSTRPPSATKRPASTA